MFLCVYVIYDIMQRTSRSANVGRATTSWRPHAFNFSCAFRRVENYDVKVLDWTNTRAHKHKHIRISGELLPL